MRQQVNLFQDVLRPVKVMWSAKQLVLIVSLFALMMMGLEAFGMFQIWNIKQDIVNSEQVLINKQQEIKFVEAKHPGPQEDKRLVLRVSQLDKEVRQKQQILGILSEGEYGNTHGFADHLQGLSKQHIDGIWLTRFTIDQGGKHLSLSGGSLEPELVPKFLQKLGSEASFSGKEFKSFVLSRVDIKNSWVNFDLNTELKSEIQE